MTTVLRCVMATVVALVSITIARFLYAGYAYVLVGRPNPEAPTSSKVIGIARVADLH